MNRKLLSLVATIAVFSFSFAAPILAASEGSVELTTFPGGYSNAAYVNEGRYVIACTNTIQNLNKARVRISSPGTFNKLLRIPNGESIAPKSTRGRVGKAEVISFRLLKPYQANQPGEVECRYMQVG